MVFFNIEDKHEGFMDQTMKVLLMHNPMAEEHPSDVFIVMEGHKVWNGCGSRTTAYIMLMKLMYALSLECPKKLKYTFEMFQKLFLELDENQVNPEPQM